MKRIVHRQLTSIALGRTVSNVFESQDVKRNLHILFGEEMDDEELQDLVALLPCRDQGVGVWVWVGLLVARRARHNSNLHKCSP